MLEKLFHGINIAAAIGGAATAADITLFGGAASASSAALSAISILKKSDRPTKEAKDVMAPIIVAELHRSPLPDDHKKVVLALLVDHPPDFTDIANGSLNPAQIAKNKRVVLEKTTSDPARLNSRVLRTFEAVLAAALEPVVAPTDQQEANTAAILRRMDRDGEFQRMRDEGITEKAIIRLATRIVQGATDLTSAWTAIEDAIAVSIRVQQEGHAPSNHRDFVDEVFARTAHLAAEGEYSAALGEIDAALEETDARKAKLLARGVDMARLAGNAERAAQILVQQMLLDAPEDPFEALRAVQREWYERGRDAGLSFDAKVAIHLARLSVDKAANADQRGAAQNDLGLALQTVGGRESGAARLTESVVAYRAALKDCTRDRAPLLWATTQNNLGAALRTLGARDSDTARLTEAVAAYRAALQERTRNRVPLDWAKTQNNLGNALRILGERDSDTALLTEAVAAHRAALQELSRDRVPLVWAGTQNNLGIALSILGQRESGTAWLTKAVVAYRAALKEYTRDRVPLDWAATQNNLGIALQTLGARESDTARLTEAVAAYRAALQERTCNRVPLDWAATQNNLGNALLILGQRNIDTVRLTEVVAAYRAALQERNRDRVPLDWAMTQNNLGIALKTLGEGDGDTERLTEAVDAYHAALQERTRQRVPLDWATTQYNLAEVEIALFDKTADPTHLDAAQRHALEARAVFAEAKASHYLELAYNILTGITARRA